MRLLLATLGLLLSGCRLVSPESAQMSSTLPTPQQVGFTNDELEMLRQEFLGTYGNDFAQLGGPLKVTFFKSIPSYYSLATIKNGTYEVAVMGGNLDKKYMTMDSLRLLICHEIGHFLGGAPKRIHLDPAEDQLWNTVEGQADYYASLKCMRRILQKHDNKSFLNSANLSEHMVRSCKSVHSNDADQEICLRTAVAAQKLVGFFAAVKKYTQPLEFDTPDTKVVDKTRYDHPDLQCRLDTFWAGTLCPVRFDVPLDDSDVDQGVCSGDSVPISTRRPACWFRQADHKPIGTKEKTVP